MCPDVYLNRSTKLNKKTELLRAISSENDNDLTLQLIKSNLRHNKAYQHGTQTYFP